MNQDNNKISTPSTPGGMEDREVMVNEDDLTVKDDWKIGDEVWVRRAMGGATPSAASSSSTYEYYAGIVAYTGDVSFAPGQDWVGVRLTGDSAGKGKNDGAVQGIRYFAAPPFSGLFVRTSALRVRNEKSPVRPTTMLRTPPPPASRQRSNVSEDETAAATAGGPASPVPATTDVMERTPAKPSSKPINKESKATVTPNGMPKQNSKDPNFPDVLPTTASPSSKAATSNNNQTESTSKSQAQKKASTKKGSSTSSKSSSKATSAKATKVASTTSSAPQGPTASTSTESGVSTKSPPTAAATSAKAPPATTAAAAAAATTTSTTKPSASNTSAKKTATSGASSKSAALITSTKSPTQDKSKAKSGTRGSTNRGVAAAPAVAANNNADDEFRLHATTVTPARSNAPTDGNDDDDWQQLERTTGEASSSWSPPRRATGQQAQQQQQQPSERNVNDEEDKFDWSLAQQRWIRALLGMAILGLWTLTIFVAFLGLEDFDHTQDDTDDTDPPSGTFASSLLGGDIHTHSSFKPSVHACLPATLLLLVSVIAGMLRLPLCQTPRRHPVSPLAVYTSRLAALTTALTSLVMLTYIGVFTFALNDTAAQAHLLHSPLQRWVVWLLVDVLMILIPSCVALMLTFYPGDGVDADEQRESSAANPANESFQSEIVPLLNGMGGDEDGDDEDVEAVAGGDYQLLQDENEPQATASGGNRIRGSRRLLQMASSQVVYLYLGCAVLLLRLPFSLVIPHFVSTTLTALAKGHFSAAHKDILTLAVCGSIDAFLDFWCIFLFGYANLRIVKRVRLDLFQRLLNMEVAFFDAHHSGTLTSRLNSDCSAMANDLTWFFRFSIESVVRITGIAGYMLYRSPQLASCALAMIPAVAVINKIYGDWLARNAAAVQNALASTQTVAQEALTQIRTVISLGAESQMYESYHDRVLKHYNLNVRQTFWQGVYYMVVSTFLINTVVQASLLWFGAYLIYHDRLSAQVLLAFMLYQGQLQSETMNLFQSYSSLIKSSGAGEQVFSLLDRRTPPPGLGALEAQPEDNEGNNPSSLALTFDKVTFRYPSRPEHKVLDGFDWRVAAGKTVALVGPSGCGKSTVLALAQRLYDPSGGRVLVNGKDLRLQNLIRYRQHIGVVTQDCVLFDGTIFENIVFGYEADNVSAVDEEQVEHRVRQAAELANMTEFISTLPAGLETQVGEGGTQLSGGQKQRLAIARAIYRRPALLMLDEATSSLDAASERVVQEALDHLLARRKGMTTIIVAHRLQTVQQADAICVLENGKIAEQGTHKELMRKRDGIYYSMVGRAIRNNTGVMD